VTAVSLCAAIECYVSANLTRLGSHEFAQLVSRFTMSHPHNGILTLYRLSLQRGWDSEVCENKIIHSWRSLDMNRLSEFPVTALARLLRAHYLNVESEDQILDFIIMVGSRSSAASVAPLVKELRLRSLSPDGFERFLGCPLVPEELKRQQITVYTPGRIARRSIRCLVLGACDQPSLNEVKELIGNWVLEENLMLVRADKPHNLDFSDYHSILVFGFFKFWEREALGKALFAYHNSGGGLIIAYGACRTDGFGLGKEVSSILPIEIGFEKPPIALPEKEAFNGCRNLRLVCTARDDGTVQASWDDGVPFVVSKPAFRDEGAITLFNAIPLSNRIIAGQPAFTNRILDRTLGLAIVSVAGEVYSRRRSRLSGIGPDP
jgi:hypothetical protein